MSPGGGATTVDRNFRLVFFVVLGFTVLFVGGAIYSGLFIANPTPSQASTMEWLQRAAWAGLGVIFGLLGGKTV
ncbi:hypothetical protein AB0K16_55095 [Nonomuraea jabiensis]|uniref:hypothetical protein n=1 Tax=Nonomuraea jabiensis TaxID=882448 RepID=UPI0034457D79